MAADVVQELACCLVVMCEGATWCLCGACIKSLKRIFLLRALNGPILAHKIFGHFILVVYHSYFQCEIIVLCK